MGKIPELLCPAGDFERLRYALAYGADAVYLAGKQFGMRAASGNFTEEQLGQAVKLAHSQGKRVFVTTNTMPRNGELEQLPAYLEAVGQAGADAFLVADIGVMGLCQKYAPQAEIHISTQANVTNYQAALAWYQLGAKRVVLARELSLEEIREIRAKTPPELELEVFVHGAMCMSYSGRCYLSDYLTGRDANRGACAQPCRWQYSLVEQKRPGQRMDIVETEQGSYLLNSKDLCMIDHIPELVQAGVDSLKIEGRMKTAYYTAVTANAYRRALDAYQAWQETGEKPFCLPDWVRQEVEKTSHREYYTGFFFGRQDGQHRQDGGYQRPWDLCALALGETSQWGPLFSQRNKFSLGDHLELIDPEGPPLAFTLEALLDQQGNPMESAPHPCQTVILPQLERVHPMALLRRQKEQEGPEEIKN